MLVCAKNGIGKITSPGLYIWEDQTKSKWKGVIPKFKEKHIRDLKCPCFYWYGRITTEEYQKKLIFRPGEEKIRTKGEL